MKNILLICAILVFSVTAVNAEEQAREDVPFWVKIRLKIEQITPQKKPTVTTAVGGVRGAKRGAGKELYWKGEAVNPVVIGEQELARFDEALQKVEAGETEAARQLFEGFVVEFPASELKTDALLALKEMDKDAGEN